MEEPEKPAAALPPPTHEDPSKIWWGPSSPPAAPPLAQQIVPPSPQAEWRLRWTPWVGIMYGPIPVGLIIGLPILIGARAC